MGIQANDRVSRDFYHRDVSNQQIIDAQKVFREVGIRANLQIIWDDPVSTEQDKDELFHMLMALPRPFELYLFGLTIYPETHLARRLLRDLTSDVGIAVSSSEVGFQVAKRVLEGFDFAVALERMDERAARKLSGLLGTTVSFPHHRARAGASGGFNRRAAAVPTSIRDRILREHDVDVRLHAWLAARDP